MYHNVQSLKKNIHLIQNDRNFTSHDVLLFGETWLKQNEKIKIHGYELVSLTEAPPISKPQGVAILVKTSLLPSLHNTGSVVLKDTAGRIDAAWITLNKKNIGGSVF